MSEIDISIDENGDFDIEVPMNKYLVYFCYEWGEFDSCIQFYIEVEKEYEFENDEIIMQIIHEHDGIAKMDDGSIVNLSRFVQAYVYLQDDDFDIDKQDDNAGKSTPTLRVVH